MVMESLRNRNVVKWVSIFIAVAFVLTIFFSWGMNMTSSRGGGKRTVVGKLDDKTIYFDEFQPYVQNSLKEYQERYKNSGQEMPDFAVKMAIDQAWDSVIRDYIFEKNVERFNLTATAQEIVDYVKNTPPDFIKQQDAFKTDGKFDKDKYLQALANPEIDWTWLEESIKTYIPKKKLQDIIMSNARISDQEVKDEFVLENTKAKIKFIQMSTFNIKDQIDVSDEEIKAYYDEHSSDYEIGDQAKIDYVIFTDAAKEEQVKASHILIKVDDKRDDKAAKTEADKIYKELTVDGKDFAEMAIKYSEDKGSAVKGGDLGYFDRKRMVAPFTEVAFATEIGAISEPVKTQFGYHIIKVMDKKLPENQEEIDAKVNEALVLLKDSKDINAVAKKYNSEVQNTGLFTQDKKYLGALGKADELVDFAFSADVNDIGESAYAVKNGQIVYVLSEFVKNHIQTLEEVQPKVKNALTKEKKDNLLKEKVAKAEEMLKNKKSLDDIAKELGFEVTESDMFSGNGNVKSLGRDTAVHGVVMKSAKGDIVGPIEVSDKYYIAEVLEKEDASMSEFEKQKDLIRSTLMTQKQNECYQEWFTSEKNSIKIKDNRYKLFNI